ncbi:DUF2628 domain-containing protein [Phreatobacter aquaticus]|uniref:DUF2628 domain-containing protein n=1 Tax=Phreatobacter aquaticus TaxID=2570229 RepID=A0A4D7QDM9_9HYPH|nr:DUF2628 domain-containing protein [Phreatobacter aquaticus]QCK85318.1 DUF2628 domain-containing protein [Phreatobacter aquaticus]
MAKPIAFTVHLPPPRPGRDPDTAIQFVADRFHWSAFLLPSVYFLWHFMWLTAFVYILLFAAVAVGLAALGLAPMASLGIAVLLSLLVGLEAPQLRRRSLARRGYMEQAVVVAETQAAAERRYFAERASAMAPLPASFGGPPMAAPYAAPVAGSGIIGLFPEAEPRARGAS